MLLNQNVVLVASHFQPSAIGEYWLVKNDIAPENGIYGAKICTSDFANYTTGLFEMLVLPDKATFNIKPHAAVADAHSKICKFVDSLSNVPLTGMGLNFAYQIADGKEDVAAFTRERFAAKQTDPMIGNNTTVWGSIAITRLPTIRNSVMRLQVVPVFPDGNTALPPTGLLADFNFHFKVGSAAEVREILENDFANVSAYVSEAQSKITSPALHTT